MARAQADWLKHPPARSRRTTGSGTLSVSPFDSLISLTLGVTGVILPPAADHIDGILIIKNRGAEVPFDITAAAGDTIDGQSTLTIDAAFASVALYSDGVNKWDVTMAYPGATESPTRDGQDRLEEEAKRLRRLVAALLENIQEMTGDTQNIEEDSENGDD